MSAAVWIVIVKKPAWVVVQVMSKKGCCFENPASHNNKHKL